MHNLLKCQVVIFPVVWDFRARPFPLFLGPFLGAKRARFLTGKLPVPSVNVQVQSARLEVCPTARRSFLEFGQQAPHQSDLVMRFHSNMV